MASDLRNMSIQEFGMNLGPKALYTLLAIISCGLVIAGDEDESHRISRFFRRSKRNTAPSLLGTMLTGHYIDEDSPNAPFLYTIKARDPDGDTLVYFKTPGAAEARRGNWSLEKATGTIKYWPYKDAYGADFLYFTVSEERSDVIPAQTINSTFVIDVRPVPDPPVMFLSQNGNSLIKDLQKPVRITMEENSGHNAAYKDLQMILGAYDVDGEDNHTAVVTKIPSHGTVTLSAQNSDVLHYPRDCNQKDYRRTKNKLSNKALPPKIPCDLRLPHRSEKMSWVSTVLTYKPDVGFSGNDTFQVIVYDNRGLPSRTPQNMLTVIVQVLQNPCQNGGTCYGRKNGDISCTDPRRTAGFDRFAYACHCPPGWTGTYCQYDFNECFSTPCVAPFVCVDKLDGYRCECPSNNRVCQPSLPSWQMALITTSVGVFIATFTIFIIFIARKRQERRRPSLSGSTRYFWSKNMLM